MNLSSLPILLSHNPLRRPESLLSRAQTELVLPVPYQIVTISYILIDPYPPPALSIRKEEAHFFSSHFDGIKRRFGSGALESGCISSSLVNQSASGSNGFTFSHHVALTYSTSAVVFWGLA